MPKSYSLKPRSTTATINVRGLTFKRKPSLPFRFHPYCGQCREVGKEPIIVLTSQEKLADTLTMPYTDADQSIFRERSFSRSSSRTLCSRHYRLFDDVSEPELIRSPEKPKLKPFFEVQDEELDKRGLSWSFDNNSQSGSLSSSSLNLGKKSKKDLARPTLQPFYNSNDSFCKLLKKISLPTRKN